MLGDEYGTASNIKSRITRLSVLAAITSAQQRLKLYTCVVSGYPVASFVLLVSLSLAVDVGGEGLARRARPQAEERKAKPPPALLPPAAAPPPNARSLLQNRNVH